MSVSSAIGPLPISQLAPIDIVMDLVVAGLRASEELLRFTTADQINAYETMPAPDVPIFSPAVMVAPLTSTDVVSPGEVLSTVFVQIVLRYQTSNFEPKPPGAAGVATILWEATRVLFGLKYLIIRNSAGQTAQLADDCKAVPVAYPAGRTQGGWVRDIAQGWQFRIPLDKDTLRPRALAAIGLD